MPVTEPLEAPADIAEKGADKSIDHQETLRETVEEMLREQWEHRELLWRMTLRDLRLRYVQAIMGFGWALFMPLLIVSAGLLVKYAMAHTAGVELESASVAGMAVKSIPWAFFVGSISFAVNSLTSNLNLVTKIYFPREVFPFSAVLTQLIDSLVGAGALVVLLFFLRVPPTWNLLWTVPLTIDLVLFTAGVSLFVSCGNLFYRDVKYIVQVVLTFGIFFVPVFFDPENLGPRGGSLLLLNPLAIIIEGFRLAVVSGQGLLATQGVWQWWHLPYATLVSVLIFALSWLMFHRLEFLYAERI